MSRRRRDEGDVPRNIPLPVMIDGAASSELNFTASFENLDAYIFFMVYGDRGQELGHAVGKILQRFEKDSEGCSVQLQYLGCSDPYYRWYIEHEGERGGLPRNAYHHLCRRHHMRCARALGGQDTIHIQRWTPVSRQEANDLLKSWGGRGLPAEPRPPARDRKPAGDLNPAPKSKARQSQGLASLPAPKVDEPQNVDDDEDEDEPEARPPLRRSKKRGPKQRDVGHAAALDVMLDEGDVNLESPLSSKKVDDRLAHLRAKLRGKQAEARVGRSTGSVLAARATEVSQKPKKKKKKKGILDELKKALSPGGGRTEKDDSEEDSDDQEDDLVIDEPASSSWQNKRRRLRKIADDKPGKLLMDSLQGLHEQLGSVTGEEASDSLSPVLVRYLLTMVVPSFPGKLHGTEKYRELRTLAQAVDLLLKGKVDAVGDLLVQRFKSLVMGLRDGTEKFGHVLELIPEESLGVTSDEVFFARELAVKAAKSEALLKG